MLVEQSLLSDGRTVYTIAKEDRVVTVIPPSREVDISQFKKFDHAAKGEGCSIYRPMRMKDGTTRNLLIRGSMALMAELGWIDPSELGSFSDLEFDNHARTGVFEPGVKVRFALDDWEDIKILNSPIKEIFRTHEWSSWDRIVLQSGYEFYGQPAADLRELVELGIVQADKAKLYKIEAALNAVKAAQSAYREEMKALGAEINSEGSDEDSWSWYEVPGVPGRYPTY